MSPDRRGGGISPAMMSVVDDDTEVYRLHAQELIRYATALVGPHDAADVVADAVVAAFATPAWPLVEDRRAYLYRAVFSRAQMHGRSSARRRRREERVAVSPTFVPSDSSIDAQRALSRLSAQQRAVIYLTYWGDLTPASVAELLGLSEGTVRKQLARGRDRLREVFERER